MSEKTDKGTFGCPFFRPNFADIGVDKTMMRVFVLISAALLSAQNALAQAQYITSPVTEAARSAPSGPLSPAVSARASDSDAPLDRIEALELRLSQMEQLLNAQRTLQARQNMNEAMKLRQRMSRLETQLKTVSADAATDAATSPATGAYATTTDTIVTQGGGAVPTGNINVQSRLNDVTESLRIMQAQTDELLIEMRTLKQQLARSRADNEFRFQALESGVRRAVAGISSTSDEPEVIGFVKRSAPVEGLEAGAASAASASGTISDAAATKLVGEGDLSALEGFAPAVRTPLNDPKKLYDRALSDLQSGNYAGAEADFAQLVEQFPSHKMAGNAQYWLGETYYVRRQFKQAAQAFLAGYTTYAESKKAPDSLLKLGMTLTALGEKKTGCDAFAELNAKFPDAPDAVTKRAQIERKRAGCVAS